MTRQRAWGPPPPPDAHPPAPEPAPARWRRWPFWLAVAVGVLLSPLVLLEVGIFAKALISPPQFIPSRSPQTATTVTSLGQPIRTTAGPFTATSGSVTLTVRRVEAGTRWVRLHLTVANGAAEPLDLSATNFAAVDDTAHRYEVDINPPGWPRDDLRPGTEAAGTIDLLEPVAPGARAMTVGFADAFSRTGTRNLYVQGIVLS